MVLGVFLPIIIPYAHHFLALEFTKHNHGTLGQLMYCSMTEMELL